MIKKLLIMLLVGGLLVFGSEAWAASSGETNNCGWTNLKFAEFLAPQYGIQPIEGSVHDRYQALANALAQKGINYFTTTKANAQLNCCGAADALYAVVGAQAEAGSCDLKINYLIQNGIIKLPVAGGDPCSALCNIPDTFRGVERFSPSRRNLRIDLPDPDPENPSTRIGQ